MPNSTDFSGVTLNIASTTGGKVTGSVAGTAITTTTYPAELTHVHVEVTTASGGVGAVDGDVSVQKPPTAANEAVTISKVTDSGGRTFTIAADGKSFTSN